MGRLLCFDHVGVARVVLAQEVFAVVVAVRGAHDGMDVVARGRVVVERDAGEVVELDGVPKRLSQ
jgi:hypothetical protein